jgi:hypothetical protein
MSTGNLRAEKQYLILLRDSFLDATDRDEQDDEGFREAGEQIDEIDAELLRRGEDL